MDPISAVGLASSIVQLADAAFKIVKLIDTIKDGGKDRRRLCDELTLLWMTLRNLEIQFAPLSAEQNGAWMKPIDSLSDTDGVFDQISKALDEVWDRLTAGESRRAKIVKALRWPYDKGEVDKLVWRIERLKTSVSLVLGQANVALAHEMQEGISEVRKSTTESEFKEMLDWVSPLNFRQKQESTVGSPGTGAWLFQKKKFRKWESSQEPWLWCYGIPGAGKTVMASMAVNHLRKRLENEKAIVLIAFCSFDNPLSQSVEPLIASLLKQVMQSSESVSKKLHEMYQKHRKESTSPTLSQLMEALDEAITQYDKCFIILDALDELSDDLKRLRLLETFKRFEKFKSAKGNYPQVMVTSRKLESIASHFGSPIGNIKCNGCKKYEIGVYYHCEDCGDWDVCEECLQKDVGCGVSGHSLTKRFNSLRIEISAQPQDIESYVNERIEMEPDLSQFVQKNPGLREQILNTVVAKAKHMFLLAKFHMDALADCVDKRDLDDALENLPKEISNTYDQAMMRIEKLTPNRQRAVKKLFMWVSYAERPLKIVELEHATAISRGVRDIRRDHILSAKALMSLSAGLVFIDESGNVRLVHETAESYFKERRETLFPGGEVQIAECCIAYLELEAFDDGPCPGPDEAKQYDERLTDFPFLGYAALYWGNHARKCDSDIVTPQARMFLRNKQHLASSVQALWYSDNQSGESWDVQSDVAPLHIAAFFGLNKIATSLIADGADVDVRDSLGTTPIIYAASKARSAVVETLISSGASTSTVCLRGSTALLRATRAGHAKIVSVLLREKDVAINQLYLTRANRSALMIAVTNDYTPIIRMLLERPDLDVNLETNTPRNWTALLFAVDYENYKALDMLLSHPQIDINHMDSAQYTALEYAARNGFIPELRLLLNHNADADTQDDQGGRPIQRAIDEGKTEAVKVLLEHNVNWDFRDLFGRTLVHSAAVNAQSEILRLLLERCKGLDVNAQGTRGETALHDAARCGYYETVKVLLEFGARTDIENNAGRTPVRSAKDAGQENVLGLLQKARESEIRPIHKADTFTTKSELPLWVAVEQHPSDVLRERIARTAISELNQISPDSGGTALHTAVSSRRHDVVTMLLDAGADPNPLDSFDRTPLILACQSGNMPGVRRLVEHGADLNIAIFRAQPAWEIAFLENWYNITTYLQAQPNCDIKSNSSRLHTCLVWAAYAGNMEAARRLVEAGAPVHLKSTSGKTASQIAKENGYVDVERYLVEEAAKQRVAVSPPLVQKEEAKATSEEKEDQEVESVTASGMKIVDKAPVFEEKEKFLQRGTLDRGNGSELKMKEANHHPITKHKEMDFAKNPIVLGVIGVVLLATLIKVWFG